jgi:uncharacterized protein (DUF1800 family)
VSSTDAALLSVTRFGLGPKAGEIVAAETDPRGYVLGMTEHPNAALIVNPPIGDLHHEMRTCLAWNKRRSDLVAAGLNPKSPEGRAAIRREIGPRCFGLAYDSEVLARTDHSVATQAPFVERLVLFWSNHFAISAAKREHLLLLAGDFERIAIRPYVLGSFYDMLQAVVSHPAMILYLDNQFSAGPNSRQGKRRGAGLNENLAREILELHTLGVDAGYTQQDVTNFARILTGWSTSTRKDERPFEFRFEQRAHEPARFPCLAGISRRVAASRARRFWICWFPTGHRPKHCRQPSAAFCGGEPAAVARRPAGGGVHGH